MKKLDVPQSGSQAATVASRNRFGQYNRTRATPTNPNTTRQSLVRSRLSDLSIAWQALSDGQRLLWQGDADAHPVTDSLGQTIVLTGHQRYISVNSARLNAGLAQISVPGDESAVLTSAVFDGSGDTMSLVFAPTPVPANTKLVIEASPLLSPGRTFNGDYRFITAVAAAGTSPASIGDGYTAKFGGFTGGKRVFIRAYFVGTNGASTKIVSNDVLSA